MSLPVAYHRLASRDIVSARRWYEDREAGLGDRFVVAVSEAVEQISRWPNAATPASRGADGKVTERTLPTPGFPFLVRYRVRGSTLVVVAVHHQRRRPDFGAERT